MLRYLIIIALLVPLLFISRLAMQTATVEPLPPAAAPDKPAGVKVRGEKVRFYPDVPDPLPDLNSRYVFNEERQLALVAQGDGEAKVQVAADGLRVNMDDLYYSGSVIIGDRRRALVSFSELAGKDKKKKASRSKKKKASASRKYARLKVDDTLGVYTVIAIETDRIVFKLGKGEIVKNLFDKTKKRLAPPPILKSAPKASKVKKARKKAQKTSRPPKIVKLPMLPRPGN